MAATQQHVPTKEKIGYAMGDIATNFFFQSMILYQTRFYTDTAGLSAGAVSYMLFILRIVDAFVDPFVGGLSDRTQSRWGKFRPWILGTAVPFGLIFWLTYVTPDFGPSSKLVYAYITYSLLMMMYSANNTPYSALMAVMTPDSSERSSIASYRFVGALIGQFIIQGLPLPLVAKIGQGNSAKGWAVTMSIFAENSSPLGTPRRHVARAVAMTLKCQLDQLIDHFGERYSGTCPHFWKPGCISQTRHRVYLIDQKHSVVAPKEKIHACKSRTVDRGKCLDGKFADLV